MYQPLTPAQFQQARDAGFSVDQIIKDEAQRKSEMGNSGALQSPSAGVQGLIFPNNTDSVTKSIVNTETNLLPTVGDIGAKLATPYVNKLTTQASDIQQQVSNNVLAHLKANPNMPLAEKQKLVGLLNDINPDIAGQVPDIQKTLHQYVGDAYVTGSTLLPFLGGMTGAIKGINPQTMWQGIKQGAGLGAKIGGVTGLLRGTGTGLQDNTNTLGDIAVEAASQGTIGALGGAFGGAITGGLQGMVQARIQRNQQLEDLFKNNPNDARAAMYSKTEDKIIKDPTALKAVDQGADPKQIAIIKAGSPADKAKMAEMMDIAQRGSTDPRFGALNNPSDVPGQTLMERLKYVNDVNQQAATQLDSVAKSLKGQSVDSVPELYNKFTQDLIDRGVTITDKGLDFTGSQYEDLGSVGKSLDKVYARLNDSNDAYDLHGLKKYIYNIVDYGNSTGGTVGDAQGLLKNVAHGIDTALDTQFPKYDAVNTQFADTINVMDDVNKLMGRNFKIGDSLSNVKAGLAMRRILGNSGSGVDIRQSLDALQNVAKQYGFKGTDDIVNQILFADSLDDMFTSNKTTSLQGQTGRAIKDVLGNAAISAAKGNFVKAGEKALMGTAALMQGNQFPALINSIKALLK